MKNPFGLTVRDCEEEDFEFFYRIKKETLFPIIAEVTEVNYRRAFTKKNFDTNLAHLKILMKGKRRIGFYAIIEKEPSTAYIQKLFLSPAYQGKGIGSFLLRHFETLGYDKLQLSVWKNNPAVKLYRKFGYEITKTTDTHHHMEKELS